MKNYVDMYAQIIDRLMLDVIEHGCVVTLTVLNIWSVLPMCSVNVVSITVINSQNNSSTAEYNWEHDEVEGLIYAFANEWSADCYNESVMQHVKSELLNQPTALATEVVEIIDRFVD